MKGRRELLAGEGEITCRLASGRVARGRAGVETIRLNNGHSDVGERTNEQESSRAAAAAAAAIMMMEAVALV